METRNHSNLALMGSLNIANVGNGPVSKTLQTPTTDPNKLKKVKMNMEKEKALQFRQNTQNRGYGFQQVLSKEVPQNKLHLQEKKLIEQGNADYTDYRFTVAGNGNI